MSPKNPRVERIQGHAVYRNCCAACVEGGGVGGQHRIELLEEEEGERTTSHVALGYGFHDGKTCRHVSNADLSRQHVWSNGSDML